jgi:dienelactone hydrolase
VRILYVFVIVCLPHALTVACSSMGAEPSGSKQYELPFTATDREAALAWQKHARQRLSELVAAQTPRRLLEERPLDFKIESSEDRGDYTLHHASFQCNDGDRRPCLWTVPKGQGPYPAMLCLHGHGGSAEKVFDAKTEFAGFADRFASGGYCVLAPTFPHRDYAASTLWDLIRCVDILSAQKEVDATRIGVMGLSMGGEWTMWVAACDERLQAAVISGWMCTTEGVLSVPNCVCWKLPGFLELMDVCEVHLLIAPRPVLFESAEGDPYFPIGQSRAGFARLRAGYRVFGAEESCAQDVFPGGHAVHGSIAFPFVDKVLGGHAGAGA